MWHRAAYAPAGSRTAGSPADYRLRAVCEPAEGLPVPASYDELKPYVSRARQLISSGGNPVIIVNGDTDETTNS